MHITFLSESSKVESSHGRCRSKYEGNIKMNIVEMESEGVDWIKQVTDRWNFVVTIMILRVS
jgi:hypothetical protein